ncbi:XkdQ/YqbQ family protein [Sporomusa acidovorans]|uniref:YqbQ/XkdQ domain-containing protein n=1 Tax=Sporomusa acidovorans (strain ATCC 49682 / DSM 3132 / Mol) TaxID=1123286 RepID=A0ABZ3J6B5_SPOA4|nr:hydrolase [Sporomusa acidovorans]OZC23820.1 hypothetical protein SPACI_04450 [Sporomusa acidovorans DSM 3132]SDF62194.1 hypothetical protein SAMN04488499_106325 [Sporomusa acidovorans]
MSSKVQIIIQNGDKVYEPVIREGIAWETERKGVPGKLTFKVLIDSVLNFTEGNLVKMTVNGTNTFCGFVFTKKRDKDGIIQVTAYDQLRYLKNKDCYIYPSAMTAAELVKVLAAKYRLQVGEIEDTEYIIEKRVEDNTTLFDIIQTALGLTLQNKKKLYVLYDDFGKLTLKNIENLKLDLLIDAETAEDFDYISSIDSNTYNKIKLFYDNKDTGERELYETQSGENINRWGVLQYCDSIQEKTNGQAKADALLGLYNKKTRSLTIDNAFGDIRVRAGTSISVQLDLGDIKVNNYMLVERAKHIFTNNQHVMNLSLRGRDIFE